MNINEHLSRASISRHAWLLLAALSCAAGCTEDGVAPADGATQTSATAQDLYVKGSRIWLTLSIPVCWENPSAALQTERAWVQNKVATTWSAVSEVVFTGWETCQPGQRGIRIRIAGGDEPSHVVALGRDLDGATGGMVLNFTFMSVGSFCQFVPHQTCVEATAVQQFGQALGFAREQNRPDRPASCGPAQVGGNGDTTIGSWDANSVMNSCAPDADIRSTLSANDIIGVRQYYGSPTFRSNRKAAIVWPTGKIYFFNGSQYTRYDVALDRADSGYPVDIATFWRGWPAGWNDGVDAGIDWGNGKAYFFRDSQYLRYDIAADRVDAGYPLPVDAAHWPGWPVGFGPIDAVVKSPAGKVYFFSGSMYLRYDIATDHVDPGFPARIDQNWPGLFPSSIDYGLAHPNGYYYFFQGTQYQRFDFTRNAVDFTVPIVGEWPGAPF